MAPRDLAMGIIFLIQTALGILGNTTFLCHFLLADFTGTAGKSTDIIVKHLTWANFMILLFKGIPQIIDAFGLTYFLDDVMCKLIFYFHRVARGVCLESTTLLSIFQAIIISPSNPKSVQLKVRAPKIIGPFLGLCWTLQLLLNIFIPMNVTDIWGVRNQTGFRNFLYCAVVKPHSPVYTLYSLLLAFIDILCLGLMAWASSSMVFILLRHKQRVQHIHSSLSPNSSSQARAIQSILTIVSSFVFFYITSAILMVQQALFDGTSTWLVNTNVLMTACFPTLCPFLLIRHYITLSKFCCTCSCQAT